MQSRLRYFQLSPHIALFLMLILSGLFMQNFARQDLSNIQFRNVSSTYLPAGVLGNNSMDVEMADIDLDGDIDLVIASEFRPNLILLNDGSGHFSNGTSGRLPQLFHDSEDIAIADFDQANGPDILFVSEDDQTNELYLNDSSGVFSDATSRLGTSGTSNAVLAAYFNDDNYPDIIIGNAGQNVLLINDGTGFFNNETAQRLPVNFNITQDLELGDVDDDGDLDLIEGNENGNRLLFNDGNGFFSDSTIARLPLPALGEETREADFADVDGDGDLDLYFANVTFGQGRPNQNRLLFNDGNGFFSDSTATHLPQESFHTVDGDFADLDDDGDLDLVIANAFGGNYQIYANDGKGKFIDVTATAFLSIPIGSGIDVEILDVNTDGIPDLYLSVFTGQDFLYLGERLTAVEPANNQFPSRIELAANYPNPFNPSTIIPFQLSSAAQVSLDIFDVHGKLVRTLLQGRQEIGLHQAVFHAGYLSSGIYFYRLQVDGYFQQTRKMILMR